jgi:hypothetical protein
MKLKLRDKVKQKTASLKCYSPRGNFMTPIMTQSGGNKEKKKSHTEDNNIYKT